MSVIWGIIFTMTSASLEIDSNTISTAGQAFLDQDAPLLLLLHGYGSNEQDLIGLAPYLPENFALASLRAPLSLPWPGSGFSWYPIEALQVPDSAGVTAGAQALLRWVSENVPASRAVGLLGFSQGGAISVQALRLDPGRFSFAVNLAGYADPGELAGDDELTELKLPVFWGRGSRDEVIPDALIEHTKQWLPHHSKLSGRVYEGLTHSVSEAELQDVAAFIAGVDLTRD